MFIIEMLMTFVIIILFALSHYFYYEAKEYKALYKQAIKDWFAIASKRNEAEKEANYIEQCFKSTVRYIKKLNK